MDGTYSFVYCGNIGLGIGVLTITDGVIVGSDYAGGKYNGKASIDKATGEAMFDFTQFTTGDAFLVQGVQPLGLNSTRSHNIRLRADFANGEPLRVEMPPGVVTLMIKRVPDEYAHFAAGCRLVPV